MGDFRTIFPSLETVLTLEPEELAVFVLKSLDGQSSINRYNFTLSSDSNLVAYAPDITQRLELCARLMEAWMWLEKELLVAPQPGQQNDWAYITPRGKKLLIDQDFASYRKGALLPSDGLDPVLVRKVKPLFIRGDYDTAIFIAFKEVEERVRKLGKFGPDAFGVPLMRRAFGPSGPLCDSETVGGEQDAAMNLFCGAMGLFKNPTSHRSVEYTDPKEVADILGVANQLLRILDRKSAVFTSSTS